MKRLDCIIIALLATCTAFASRLPIERNDQYKMAKAREILWRETALTDDETKALMELLSSPDDEVAALAFDVLAVRNADNAKALRDISSETLKYHKTEAAASLAEHFAKRETALTSQALADELKAKGREESTPGKSRTASEHLHDILTYLLLREARRNGAAVTPPEGVQFEEAQIKLLEYAFKPEAGAWNYLFETVIKGFEKLPTSSSSQRAELSKKQDYVTAALAAYSKVFHEELLSAIQSKKLSSTTRQAVMYYMWRVQFRLNNKQQRRLSEAIVLYKRPSGIAENILWSDNEPSGIEMNMLMEMVKSSAQSSRYNPSLSPYALSVIIARNADNPQKLQEIAKTVLKLPLDNFPHTIQLAEFVKKNHGKVNEETIKKVLRLEKLPRDGTVKLESYLRIILTNIIVRKARKSGEKPLIPDPLHRTLKEYDIDFLENDQYDIVRLGYKPTDEAWDFIFKTLAGIDMTQKYIESPTSFFLPTISAYPKVFFDKAFEAISRNDGTSSLCLLYLIDNAHRLDDGQLDRLFDILEAQNKPLHDIWNILFSGF